MELTPEEYQNTYQEKSCWAPEELSATSSGEIVVDDRAEQRYASFLDELREAGCGIVDAPERQTADTEHELGQVASGSEVSFLEELRNLGF